MYVKRDEWSSLTRATARSNGSSAIVGGLHPLEDVVQHALGRRADGVRLQLGVPLEDLERVVLAGRLELGLGQAAVVVAPERDPGRDLVRVVAADLDRLEEALLAGREEVRGAVDLERDGRAERVRAAELVRRDAERDVLGPGLGDRLGGVLEERRVGVARDPDRVVAAGPLPAVVVELVVGDRPPVVAEVVARRALDLAASPASVVHVPPIGASGPNWMPPMPRLFWSAGRNRCDRRADVEERRLERRPRRRPAAPTSRSRSARASRGSRR